MRRLGVGLTVPALLFAGIASSTVSAAATSTIAPGSVTYTATYNCTAGCVGSGYQHAYTASIDCAGTLSGSGVGISDPTLRESFSGTIATDNTTHKTVVTFTAVYLNGSNPGYAVTTTATPDPVTGDLSGTAVATGQAFSVTATRSAYTAPQCSTPVVTPPVVTPPVVTPPVITPTVVPPSNSKGDDNEVAGRNNENNENNDKETASAPEAAKEHDHQVVDKPEAAKPEKEKVADKAGKDQEGEHEG